MRGFFPRELHKKDYPILWDGHLARPYIISGQDARTTRNFGIFFYLEVSNTPKSKPQIPKMINPAMISIPEPQIPTPEPNPLPPRPQPKPKEPSIPPPFPEPVPETVPAPIPQTVPGSIPQTIPQPV